MKNTKLKYAIFSLLVFLIFFWSLEMFQRIKYYSKTKDESFLFYGATRLELLAAKYFNSIGPEKEETEKDIIMVMGGSTVKCDYLPNGYDWPQRLEDIFHKEGYNNIKVLNLGCNGSNSADDLMRMKSYLRNTTPKIIIFYSGINDYAWIRAAKIGDSFISGDHIKVNFIERLNAILLKHSLFYLTLKEKMAKVLSKDIDNAYRSRAKPSKKYPMVIVDNLGVGRFQKNLASAVEAAKELNLTIILGSPPVAMSKQDGYRESYDKIRYGTQKIAEKYNIKHMDIAQQFDSIENIDSLFLPDKIHVNGKGAQEEARLIYGYLKANKFIDAN